MASDTAPAAVPDPAGNTPATPLSGPTTGPLAGLLTPIEPARPTSAAFTIDPADTLPDTPAMTAETTGNGGVSSSNYRTDDTGKNNSSTVGNSVLRSFALAAIERWKKGGDARNKRLDIQKAKAQAVRVKETRTVNRTENMAGGSAHVGSGNGKHSGSKTSKSGNSNRPGNPKSRSGGSGSHGSSNGTSPGRGGHAGPSGRSGAAGTGHHTKASDKHTPGKGTGGSHSGSSKQPSGHDTSKGSKTDRTAGASGRAGKDGAPGKPGTARTSGSKTPAGTSQNRSTPSSTGHCAPDGLALEKNDKTRKARKDSPGTPSTGSDTAAADGTGKVNLKKTQKTSPGTPQPDKTTAPKNTPGSTKNDTAGTGTPQKNGTSQNTNSNQPASPSPNTRPSREAGYRDGARAATLTAHVKAYRDGVRDGYQDTTHAADQEKQRLDQAHADRKATRAEDQTVTASSTDHHTPQPVQVKEVTDTHVVLDGGHSYTRGEVRTLKQYERRMETKAAAMTKAAEGTRQLQAHATAQAEQALKFLELSKTIEGGSKLTALLTRLHDSATSQASTADELHKRVVRAAESTLALLINVEIRYGGIYQAVCDSDLTKPAELAWYRK